MNATGSSESPESPASSGSTDSGDPHPAESETAPKYYAVKQHLLDLIAGLSSGSPVPPERELASRLATSRTTVRQALSELVGDGRLIRRQGSGTYVAEPKVSWPLEMVSFTEQARGYGFTPATKVLSAQRVQADREVTGRLRLPPNAAVYRIERLRLVDDRPMALETSHLSARRFPGLLRFCRTETSLYRVLADRFGAAPLWAEERIETASATPREAKLLDTETGRPMLVLSRHSFAGEDDPMEWVRSWYRGDRYSLVARLSR